MTATTATPTPTPEDAVLTQVQHDYTTYSGGPKLSTRDCHAWIAAAVRTAADAPTTETAAASAPSGTEAERLEQYKERAVIFEDWVGISASTGAVVNTWTVPKKGVYGEPLNGGPSPAVSWAWRVTRPASSE